MEIRFDTRADAVYVRLKKGKVHKTISHDTVIVDMDRKREVIGIEVLDYSKRMGSDLEKYSVSFSDGKKPSTVSS